MSRRGGTRYEAPPPYAIARLDPRRHAEYIAKGYRFGLFVAQYGRQAARLVLPFRYEVEAFRQAWALVDRKPTPVEVVVLPPEIEARLRAAREEAQGIR